MATAEQIKEALDNIRNQVNERQAENNARLQAVEQIVCKFDSEAGTRGIYSHAGVGRDALQEFNDQPSFQSLCDWNQLTARVKLSTSIRAIVTQPVDGGSSTGSYMPRQPDQAGIYGPAFAPLNLLAAIPVRPTTRDSVEFIQLGVTGDAAEQEKEGDEKAELDFDGTLQTAAIVTIAGHTTASRQVLADQPALQQNIDGAIRNKVLARLENQIINGAGGQGKINGLLNQSTVFIPTVGQTVIDAIGEGIVRLRNAGYMPNLVIMNPLDFFQQQIGRTADDDYLLGSPVAPVPPVLWNVPVVLTAAMPVGECLILDTAHVTLLDREQPTVMLSNSHKDYFTRNLIAILGEMRAGLEVRDIGAVFKLSFADINISSQ